MFILVVALDVLATFVNVCLCVWFTTKKKHYRYDDLIVNFAFTLSASSILLDVIYMCTQFVLD